MTKPTNCHVRPAKTQINLGIRPVWSESSLSTGRKLGSLATDWAQAKTLISLGGCPGWSESSLGAQLFCCFCHEAAHIIIFNSQLFRWCRRRTVDERNSAILIQRKQSFPDVETSYIMVTIPMQYRVVVVVLFCLFFPPIYRCVLGKVYSDRRCPIFRRSVCDMFLPFGKGLHLMLEKGYFKNIYSRLNQAHFWNGVQFFGQFRIWLSSV